MKSIFLFLQDLFFVVLAFFIDTGLFLLWSQPITYSISYIFIFLMFFWHNSWSYDYPGIRYFFMLIIGFMLLLEMFLYNGCQLRYSFLYLVPFFLSVFFVHSICYNNRLLFVTVSIGVFFSHLILVENGGHDFFHINSYTYIKIIANMILIVFFSLKLHYQGRRDNRCLG